jgi:hypothetical protein
MIASHPRVHYVKEPFNPTHRPECPVRRHWHHVTEADADQFVAYLQREFAFQHSWWQDVTGRAHPRRLVGATLRAVEAWRRRLVGSRPLMKDPIAFFSAEWLAATFGMDVIVLIRHPAAFASSLERLGWTFPFENLLAQPRLLQTYLAPFEDDIRRQNAAPPDVVAHAVLAWRLIHHTILEYQRYHPDWIFLRHEDLSLRPVDEFRSLCGRLGLSFPRRVRRTIEEYSGEGNAGEVSSRRSNELRRNSRANIWNWWHRLRPEDVARVRAGTEELARMFYPEPAWWTTPGHSRASA